MPWTAQWRTKGPFSDAVLVLDDSGKVSEALLASQIVLSRLLTQMGDLESWRGDTPVSVDENDPETWGQLVIARAHTGEVIEVEPELFWHGIYLWFRSRGVDYDTPGLDGGLPPASATRPPRSALMDD
jgi:hypothetical protein